MKKRKVLSIVLAALTCVSLAGCGGNGGSGEDNSAKGEVISSQRAQELFYGIEEKNAQVTAETLDKFSYTLVSQMDDATMTSYHRFSKADRYMYSNTILRNMDAYDGYEDEYKVYLGTTHCSNSAIYRYIDEQGRLVFANNSYSDITYKNEQGVWERTQDWDSSYSFEATTEEESITAFHNSVFTQLSDIIGQLLSYSSQMAKTLEPLLEMGSTSFGGIYDIEIRSKGEGHLWIKEEMPSMGSYVECEYTDYMLSYMKSVTDNTKTGITAVGYDVISTEMTFAYNECELEYPDLTQYKFYS